MALGRPTDYREEYCEEIIALSRKGWTYTEIARHWGVWRQTLYDWKEKYPAFADAFARASEAWDCWYWEVGREGLFDITEGTSSKRFNDRHYKWLAFLKKGISEKSLDSRDNTIPPEFSDPKLSIHDRQIACDVALVNKQITAALHDSLTKCLQAQFERENGLMIVKAQQDILNLSKKSAE
jgi:hypothetical protein